MSTIKTFEDHLRQDGKSEKTIESYIGDLRGLETFLQERDMELGGALNRFAINSYRTMLLESDYEPTTINKKINSFASYNRFLIEKNTMAEMVVDYKRDRVKIAKGSEKPVEVYDEKLTDRLLLYIEDNVNVRDKVIVQLLYYTGVRVSELCSIRIKDIDFLTHQLKVCGKGGKFREVPLKPEVVESIKDYLVARQNHKYYDSEYLLLGQRGAVGRDAINNMLVSLTKKGNFSERLKPHTFRHTFCTRLINKGVPLTTVSKLAGHAHIETTAKFYVSCSRKEKEHAVSLL
ncbi:tyrosine-type recombinase/integrase [Fusibacter sp. JL216-2]|uniref:tyrosine-type recombinase/integrase n=1 Tax=Fusibacter sp. JL216-2 TaxID=3071453 RepID=UPI003D3432D7